MRHVIIAALLSSIALTATDRASRSELTTITSVPLAITAQCGTIQFSRPLQGEAALTLSTMMGREVAEVPATNCSTQLPLAIPSGIYIWRVTERGITSGGSLVLE